MESSESVGLRGFAGEGVAGDGATGDIDVGVPVTTIDGAGCPAMAGVGGVPG